MYKVKYYFLALFSLVNMFPYLTPVGWMVHIATLEKKSETSFIQHSYDLMLKDLHVIIDDREFTEEKFDPDTRTLYLSPLWLENR